MPSPFVCATPTIPGTIPPGSPADRASRSTRATAAAGASRRPLRTNGHCAMRASCCARLQPAAARERQRRRLHRQRSPAGASPASTMRPPQMDQDLRDVDLDRAHLVARAAQRRGVRQRARVLHRLQLRRQDRADRTAVDRAVGVPAGLPVDRARVQARRAADAVRASRATLRSASTLVRPLSSSTTWNSFGSVTGASTPVQIELYGFIRSPVADRGSSCRNTSRSRKRGMTFSMPDQRDQHARQRHAHPAVALRLDDADRAGVGDREVRAAEADLDAQELLAQELPRRRGEILRLDRPSSPSRHRAAEELADLGAVAVQRRHDDVRRPVLAELDDQIGEVGLERRDAGRFERHVQPRSRPRSSS